MPGRVHRRRRVISRRNLDAFGPVLRYSRSRDAYVWRGIGHWVGPVYVLRSPGGGDMAQDAAPEEASKRSGRPPWSVLKLDFSPPPEQPSTLRVVFASSIALAGSLLADALLVAIGTAVFPATRGYVHFGFLDYGRLTTIGVIVACAAWPVVTRITSTPRELFFRLAVLVTLVLFIPDLYILHQGQRADAVGTLMCMHVAIALVTYNALIRISPVPRAALPKTSSPSVVEGHHPSRFR